MWNRAVKPNGNYLARKGETWRAMQGLPGTRIDICVEWVSQSCPLPMGHALNCRFARPATHSYITWATSPCLLFLIVLFSLLGRRCLQVEDPWVLALWGGAHVVGSWMELIWVPSGGSSTWMQNRCRVVSLGLDSEDFVTDLDELVEVDLWWDGGLLSLSEVELRVGQGLQSCTIETSACISSSHASIDKEEMSCGWEGDLPSRHCSLEMFPEPLRS